MNVKRKICLPTLKKVNIVNYSLYTSDIEYTFIEGLNLVIGGNGVGKTTFINIVKYALIGLYKKGTTVRNYKGEKRISRGHFSNEDGYFKNRTKINSNDENAYVELWFNMGETSFYVKRSLYEAKILNASYVENGKVTIIEGKPTKQEDFRMYEADMDKYQNQTVDNLQFNYEKIIKEKGGLSSFDDMIFMVNMILLFSESREMILWEAEWQENILSKFLNDADLEKKRIELELEAKYQDSISRHKQEDIRAIRSVLSLDSSDKPNNDVDLPMKRVQLEEEIESLEEELSRINNRRDSVQNELGSLYRAGAELSSQINKAEKEEERLNNQIESEYWPGVNIRYIDYKKQMVLNHICPMCNSSLKSDYRIGDNECFLCHSNIVDNSTTIENNGIRNEIKALFGERESIERQIEEKENDIKRADEKARRIRVQLFEKKRLVREKEKEAVASKGNEEYININKRLDELMLEKDVAQKKAAKCNEDMRTIMKNIDEALIENTKSISDIFSTFAEAFLKIPCELTLEKVKKSKMFVPIINGKKRYDAEELSESQRFFVDYSFRMSLLSFFYYYPSFYVCETPDSSLDISYEENAADVFIKYLERPNVLILTSNLNNSTFMRYILSKCKKKNVLNLLNYGRRSDVQRNHAELNRLSKEIEGMCYE